jgi:hypothetical protein
VNLKNFRYRIVDPCFILFLVVLGLELRASHLLGVENGTGEAYEDLRGRAAAFPKMFSQIS